ncbi:MAG: RDD family protein [Ferruginibacter sp.]
MDKYSTFGQRFLSGFIDGLIFLPLALADNYIHDVKDNVLFVIWQFAYLISLTLYTVIGHGKYGQTIGKKIMNIQVLDVNEVRLIGYRRAFLRESIWVALNIVFLIYYSIESFRNPINVLELRVTVMDGFCGISMMLWFFLEVITLLFNSKRRAIHDYIAGSVVIKLIELKREKMKLSQEQLITSLQDK